MFLIYFHNNKNNKKSRLPEEYYGNEENEAGLF